jgi:hypothetical protein
VPHAELGFFIGGVAPVGLAQRLPKGMLRTAATAVIYTVAIPTTGAVGALLGAGYDLGRGALRAMAPSRYAKEPGS